MWSLVGKWIVCQQTECAGIVVQEFPNEVECPWVIFRGGHGGEPDLPIDAWLVRGDDWRTAVGVAGFGDEFVFAPLGCGGDGGVSRSFENDFVALAADAAECAIGVHQMQTR